MPLLKRHKKGKDPISLKTGMNRNGLFSVLLIVCQGCLAHFPNKTSVKQNNELYDINVRAVWGSISSGGGSSDLNDLLGTMNVPSMSEKCLLI